MKKTIRQGLGKFAARVTQMFAIAFYLIFSSQSAMAQTTGLAKAKGVLEVFRTELTAIIPTVAIIALLALGIGYATKFVEKDTFVRWAIGIIIAGSAAQLTALFFT